MDFPATVPRRARPQRRFILLLVGAAALAYTALLAVHVGATAGGSDTSGYLNSARLLAAGHVLEPQRALAALPPDALSRQLSSYLYIPLGFRPAPEGATMAPTYPVGLPLLILAGHWVVGWAHAADLVAILHALAGLAATYLLARTAGLGPRSAGLAVVIVAASPLYLVMALQAMSDVPALAWTTLAVIAALRADREPRWAAVAGAALAVDVLLRPANLLALLPVAAALGPSIRRWRLLVLAGLPGALFLLLYNHAAYGRAVTTGYGDTLYAFRLAYVPETLAHYLVWLPLLFSPLVLTGVALPWVRGVPGRIRAVLLVWIGAYAAFYCAYANTHETWWYLRFLLPAAPALVVAGVLVDRSGLALGRLPAGPLGAAAAALVLLLSALVGRRLHPLLAGQQELRYSRVCAWLRTHLPPTAVCLAKQESGALLYFTDFPILRWDEIRPGDAPRITQALAAGGRPLYAVLFRFELAGSPNPQERLPGAWLPVGAVEDVVVTRLVPLPP